MEASKLDEIRKLGIIAMFSDDELMEMLVLKGGNAISLICQQYSRASLDLDFGMEGGIDKEHISTIENKIKTSLEKTFSERGYVVIDYKFTERPAERKEGLKEFWGGYRVEFKVIEKEQFDQENIRMTRMKSLTLGTGEKKAFTIDISKNEFCVQKQEQDLEGYTIYVYTPEMVVIEKIRAICQQMQEYPYGSKSARARDFYDVYLLIETLKIDLLTQENQDLFRLIFKAKEVPLLLIGKIKDYREYHRSDFASVAATVNPQSEVKDYDYYFDYLIGKTKGLEILWEV